MQRIGASILIKLTSLFKLVQAFPSSSSTFHDVTRGKGIDFVTFQLIIPMEKDTFIHLSYRAHNSKAQSHLLI